MNKTSIMTTLLAIEIVTVLVVGVWAGFKWQDAKKAGEENVFLQGRLTVMQKRITVMQKRIALQEQEKQDCADLATFARRTWETRLDECEEKVKSWVGGSCDDLYLKCYTAMTEMSQILNDGKIEREALVRKRAAERVDAREGQP